MKVNLWKKTKPITNYDKMQDFLNVIKKLALENKNREINSDLVYSLLINYGLDNTERVSLKDKFVDFYDYFAHTPNLRVYERANFDFLMFANGKLNGNEVKLYVPFARDKIVEAGKQIFTFLASNNITHQSKIATFERNDDLVIRVNTLEDAQRICDFVHSNVFLSENILTINPFLANDNGIGLTMDNKFSFNFELCNAITNFIKILKSKNRVKDLNVESFNIYLKSCITEIKDLDLKDIYSLLSQTTSKDFELSQFYTHAHNKSIDKYGKWRERIIDPKFYLNQAILVTEKYYPGQAKGALLKYLNGNIESITRKEGTREGLAKYVPVNVAINIMAKEIYGNLDNTVFFEEMVNEYVNRVLNKNRVMIDVTQDLERVAINEDPSAEIIDIVTTAIQNTLNAYDIKQAKGALVKLFEGRTEYITNRFGDRDKIDMLLKKYSLQTIKDTIRNYTITEKQFVDDKLIVNLFVNSLNGITR